MPDDRFQYVKLPDGSYGKFRADATDAQIRAAITKDFPNAYTKPITAPQTTPSVASSDSSSILQPALGFASGMVQGLRATPQSYKDQLNHILDALGGKKLAQFEKEHPMAGPSMLLASGVPFEAAGSAVKGVSEALPSSARASRLFEDVMATARDVPIKPGVPVAEAMRGKEIAGRGGQLPKILRDFVRRTADPEAPPITYEEARDFYTNARLAMSEYLQTKPNMWRQVTIFKGALDTAIREAVTSVGKGDEYAAAMQEYRKAQALKDLVKRAAQIGIPAFLGYKADKLINSLKPR